MKTRKADPSQEELPLRCDPLRSVRARELFVGRDTLYLHEVARVLRCTERHVIDLIEEYESTGGKSGLKGLNIANRNGNASGRKCYRVPVSALDLFIEAPHEPAAEGTAS